MRPGGAAARVRCLRIFAARECPRVGTDSPTQFQPCNVCAGVLRCIQRPALGLGMAHAPGASERRRESQRPSRPSLFLTQQRSPSHALTPIPFPWNWPSRGVRLAKDGCDSPRLACFWVDQSPLDRPEAPESGGATQSHERASSRCSRRQLQRDRGRLRAGAFPQLLQHGRAAAASAAHLGPGWRAVPWPELGRLGEEPRRPRAGVCGSGPTPRHASISGGVPTSTAGTA